MDIASFYEYCLSKKGTTEHFPFDEDTLVFKVGDKMFALTLLTKWEQGNPTINLKCDPDKAEELRNQNDSVTPGYHMNKKHWNTVGINQEVSDSLLKEWIDHSYELVFRSLPVKKRNEISGL
jgi:predicted DNA-binding protein (MmcQ/YjbR family)